MAQTNLTIRMDAVGNAVPEMKKVQAQLGSLDKTMMKSTANMNRHVRGMQGVGKANKNMTRSLGMASLQFQDMAVQASMGTDALRIMTMQAPQLASIFGPKGMILGALIAVGGAIAMMGDKTAKLSFEFKRFGADMKTAFQPLIDFVRPAIDLVKKGFDLLKRGAMIAINGLVYGINYFAIVISNIPAIVREAFDRMFMRINIFELNFTYMTLNIRKKFYEMLVGIVGRFRDATTALSAELKKFGVDFPDDIGEDSFGKLKDTLEGIQHEMLGIGPEIAMIRSDLDKPFDSVTNLKDELANIPKIDLFSYFKRVKVAGEDAADGIGEKVQTIAGMMGDKFGDAFMSMFDGTKKAKDAFREMARDIIKELYRIFFVKRITGFISDALTAKFPILGTSMKAIGGPVQRGNPYIVGERGPELFVPSRTGSIVPNDKMAGGGGVVVNQTINVSTGVQQTVRTEIKSLMPQIAESAKAAVADAKRRGGSYGRAFA
jgi:hypothetical protein